MTGCGLRGSLVEAAQLVALNAIDTPGAGTRLHSQARLLRVNCEDGELGLCEGARHTVRVGGEEDAQAGLIVDGRTSLVALARLQTVGQHQGAWHRVQELARGREDIAVEMGRGEGDVDVYN